MLDVDQHIKEALKAKNQALLAGYRALKTKLTNKMTEAGREPGKALSEEEVLAAIRREVKERREANEYIDPSRAEYGENARIIEALESHLPQQLDEAGMEAAIQKVLDELKPAGPKDMGRIMGALKQVPGMDMGIASKRVKELLG